MIENKDLPAAVARAMCVALPLMQSKSRRHELVRARWVLWGCYRELGMNKSAIARHVGCDPQTIWHGLHELDRHPALCATVADLTVGGLHGANIAPLLALSAVRAGAIYAYLLALLRNTPIDGQAYKGLMLLAKQPYYRAIAKRCLDNARVGQHAWRVELHARQAGLTWVAESRVG